MLDGAVEREEGGQIDDVPKAGHVSSAAQAADVAVLTLDREALGAIPTPPPPSSEASREGWEPEQWESDREWDRSPRSPPGARGDLEAFVTSTTQGSHNIAMDGRPVAHLGARLHFPSSYGAPAETTCPLAPEPEAPLSPLRFSMPDFGPQRVPSSVTPLSSKRPGDGLLAHPSCYRADASAKRICDRDAASALSSAASGSESGIARSVLRRCSSTASDLESASAKRAGARAGGEPR